MESKSELDVDLAAERLGRGSTLVIVLYDHLPEGLLRWKPTPDRWSLLEIVNHLADEEVFDFRARIESTLRNPAEVWPPIAPQDWVAEKKYNERDPAESLDRFLEERERSLEWLRTQRSAAWSNTYVHPKVGPLSAHMLLANWIAHDFLHARQMLRLHHEQVAKLAAPETLDYAGPW